MVSQQNQKRVTLKSTSSLKELSAAFGTYTERLASVEPPKGVSDWHDAILVYQRAVKKALDAAPQPGDDQSEDEYILGVLFPVALQHQPAISEAIKGMDRDLIARMFEAGCIDEETLSLALTEEEMKAFGVGDDGQAGGRVVTDFVSLSAGGRPHLRCGYRRLSRLLGRGLEREDLTS